MNFENAMAAARQAIPKYRQREFVVKAYPNNKPAAPKYKNMLIMCLFMISPRSDYSIKRIRFINLSLRAVFPDLVKRY